MLVSFASFAGNGENILTKKIHSKVKYPELASGKKVETIVIVKLSVNELGEIVINNIDCPNAEVRENIAEQIKKIKLLPDSVFQGKVYTYGFVLEVQQ